MDALEQNWQAALTTVRQSNPLTPVRVAISPFRDNVNSVFVYQALRELEAGGYPAIATEIHESIKNAPDVPTAVVALSEYIHLDILPERMMDPEIERLFGLNKKTKAVKAPKEKLERKIMDMEIGESGWTVPWGMYVYKGRFYLNGNYTIHGEPGGTVQLEITRTEKGYSVDTGLCPDEKWDDDKDGSSYASSFQPFPVTNFR